MLQVIFGVVLGYVVATFTWGQLKPYVVGAEAAAKSFAAKAEAIKAAWKL